MITAGIDIGSISVKAVLMHGRQLLTAHVQLSGYNAAMAGQTAYDQVLARAGLQASRVSRVVTTGYGRNRFPLDHKPITEITCHAAGARFLDPGVRSVIDIGGQDAKVMVMDANGRVINFVMNDRCAAGTGRFLEVMARALEIDLEAMGRLSLTAERAAAISSTCAVFAESEVISLIAAGETRPGIIAGIHASIAARVASMCGRAGLIAPVMMTGGVAENRGVVAALEATLAQSIKVDENAQITGAIGAALLAGETKY